MVSELKMRNEALHRMELLGLKDDVISIFRDSLQVPIVYVDQKNQRIELDLLNDEDFAISMRLQEERNFMIYYVICDTGMYPDGQTFTKLTFFIVSEYEEDWEMVDENYIPMGTIEAYVYNKDNPEYSELCEVPFELVQGIVINSF